MRYVFSLTLIVFVCSTALFAQEKIVDTAYSFTKVYDVANTSVKDQDQSGTCWDFATISFLESELLKAGQDTMDLSEMFIIRHSYPYKSELYVRYHGRANYGPGGQGHDAIYVLKNFGLMPEEAYPGIMYGETKHNHGEMDALLQGMVDAIVKKRSGKITPKWNEAIDKVLEVYLGECPNDFVYNGETFTPKSFAESLALNPDDYIELTSYTHHPFYEEFILEIPDNWANEKYYNLPLNDLMESMEHALENGYTIMWDGDVSDRYFKHKKGVAIVPAKSWKEKSQEEKDNTCKIPEEQKEIDQSERQKGFDNQTATDDHLMHIVGLYTDQHGVKYFKTKNSWDSDSNDFGGYLYLSEAFVRLNTVAIMINKNALPNKMAKQLNLK
jgi:bleomycin hydrolase